jgi:hypothetical protein
MFTQNDGDKMRASHDDQLPKHGKLDTKAMYAESY